MPYDDFEDYYIDYEEAEDDLLFPLVEDEYLYDEGFCENPDGIRSVCIFDEV